MIKKRKKKTSFEGFVTHLIRGFETCVRDLGNGQLLVVSLLCGYDGGVRGEREVDTRVRHEVGLELRQIHIQSAVEPGVRRSDG